MGQRSSLEEWYRGHWPDLYRYVYHHVQNRQEAEDLAQEAFARALPRSEADLLPTRQYLFTTALNLIRDRWRHQRRSGTLLPLEEAFFARAADDDAIQSWIAELLGGLSPEYRAVLELRIIQGFSRAETARLLGRSEDAIRSMQYRALQLLRAHVKEV